MTNILYEANFKYQLYKENFEEAKSILYILKNTEPFFYYTFKLEYIRAAKELYITHLDYKDRASRVGSITPATDSFQQDINMNNNFMLDDEEEKPRKKKGCC